MAIQDTVPDIRPRAGHDLRAGIDAVLPRLDAPQAAAEDLLTALVRTAACGDICRVRESADAVRQAAALLREGATERARDMLTQARSALSTPRD